MKGGYRSPHDPSEWRERDLDRDARQDDSGKKAAPHHGTESTRMNAAGEIAEGGRNSGGASGEMRHTEQH